MAPTNNKNQPKNEMPEKEAEKEALAEAAPKQESPKQLTSVMFVKRRSKGNFNGSTIEFPAGAPIYDKYQMHTLPKMGVDLVEDRNECDRW